MADFSLLAAPNFASAALGGYQAGAALGRQKRFEAALGNIDLSRPETVMPLLAADPERATPILGAALKIADARRESEAHAAFGDAVASMYGQPSPTGGSGALPPSSGVPTPATAPSPAIDAGGGASVSPTDPAGAPAAVGSTPVGNGAASDPSGGDVVVTGHRLAAGDPRSEAMTRLAYRDPEAFKSLVDVAGKLDEAKVKTLADSQGALGTAAMIARKLPYEQRRARIQQLTPWLLQHHVTQQQVDGFDPTDENLDNLHDESLGVQGIMEQANKDRTFQLDQARLGETAKHDRAVEGTAAANAATARGQLGVARGRLSLAKTVAGGTGNMGGMSSADLTAIARGQKAAPKPSASDIFAIAGDE